MKTIKLQDKIYTNPNGYKQLINFYYKANKFKNIEISIDLYDLKWLDANLCALFEAVLYKLHKDNNLTFLTDHEFLKNKFNVLFRNGFVKHKEITMKGSVPLAEFNSSDKDGFIKYIDSKLMRHRTMLNETKELKDQIREGLIEIFTNINLHAETKDPFFVCIQFYPIASELKLTMVDLGVGFLRRINKFTNGKINTSQKAIEWALVEGNSTKQGVPGGLGLKNIYQYCIENNGRFDIITGDAYWSSLSVIEKPFLDIPFFATTINLFFSYK